MTQDEGRAIGDQTADLLGLADVKRWGVIKTLRTQSVAEHSFAVAVIARELSLRLGTRIPSGDLLWWALIHDVPETLTGDIDGKFKQENDFFRGELREAEYKAFPWYARVQITPEVRWVVKTADKIETTAFIRMWGHGPRADDVYQELRSILFDEIVPELAKVTPPGVDAMSVVRDVLHYSMSEVNSIQMRRHRR